MAMRIIFRVAAPVCAFLMSAPLFSQELTKTDTLQAAIKSDVRGGQRSLNERIVLAGDFSMMASPTGQADFVKFVQTLPGVAGGSDGSSSYYVRGGNMGGNVQTLDGVPVYGTSHLVGLATVYPSGVISAAEFQAGGFTSEEGNLSSSHIKLRSKDGSFNEFSAKAEISNLLLGGYISAPLKKDRLSLNASLRVSPAAYEYKAISGLMDPDAISIDDAKAAIYDAYAKLKYRIDSGKSLSLTAFHSLDNYNFIMDSGSEDNMAWSNFLAILQYDSPWRKRGNLSLTASFNHYDNAQGMMKLLDETSNNLQIRSLLDEAMFHAMVNTSAGRNWKFRYGLKWRSARFNPGTARVLETTGVFPKSSSPLVDKSTMNHTGTAHGQLEVGSYDKSMFRLAGRLNYNSVSGVSPEVSAMGRVRLLKWMGVEVTGDYLTQFYHTLEGVPLGWSLDMIVPPSDRLLPERTSQVYAGLYSDAGDHHLSAGAYYKKLSNLVYFADASKLFDSAIAGWEENIEVGSGTSRGVEVMYEKTGKILSWRLAYTWSKTDRLFPNLNNGDPFPAKYDRTHVVNATASAKVVEGDKIDLSLAGLFTYQTGHLETVQAGYWHDDTFITGPVEIAFYTSFNNYRMPPYIRCDLSAEVAFKNTRHPQTLNVGVYNILNRHNPFSLSYDPDTETWKKLSLLPIMPSLRYSISF